MPIDEDFSPAFSFHSWELTKQGLVLFGELEMFGIDFLGSGLLRLRSSVGCVFLEKPSAAVLPSAFYTPEFALREEDDSLLLISAELEVRIARLGFSLEVKRRSDGAVLLDSRGHCFLRRLNGSWCSDRRSSGTDAILGLGEKAGPWDRNGREWLFWNTDVLSPDPLKPVGDPTAADFDPYYMSIPFWLRLQQSGPASAHFIDHPGRLKIGFRATKGSGRCRIEGEGGAYCEYIFAQESMAELLGAYSRITGLPAQQPLWSLGAHQCRWKAYSQEEVLSLARRLRAEDLPCDALWLDIDHMRGYRVFTWNDELFPDRAAMKAELEAMGFRLVTIIDPGVKLEAGWELFEQAKTANLLCLTEDGALFIGQVWPGRTTFPDFSRSECRDWWAQRVAEHARGGVDGIWNDMNEPATGEVDCSSMRFGAQGEIPHWRHHNEYALFMAEATRAGLLLARPGERPFILSRAGSPGIQRLCAHWMGDNVSNWEHLALSVRMALSLGLSGQPHVGADIGGFIGASNPELFVRWAQLGALYPFCRNHNDDERDQYPWSFGPAVAAHVRRALKLRYRLLPLIYTLSLEASSSGAPMMRPLSWHSDEPHLRRVDDQFLLGPHLMVAPVLLAGAISRPVHFPAGEWLPFDENGAESIQGPDFRSVAAPLDHLPIFVRAGAVLPLWPEAAVSTMRLKTETMELHIFLPRSDGKTASSLRLDDGISLNHDFQHFDFELIRKGDSIRLLTRVSGREGAWTPSLWRLVLHRSGGPEKTLEIRHLPGDLKLDGKQ